MKVLKLVLSTALSLTAVLITAPAQAAAHKPLKMPCAWAPHNPEVCEARKACAGNPRNPTCAIYCNVNPRDVVCGEVYQKPMSSSSPWYNDSPYPWARSGGGFCQQNPFHPACQNNFWN